MPVVTLTGLVVVPEHANAVGNQREPILEQMIAALQTTSSACTPSATPKRSNGV
jgi:hypothetical protein